MSNLFERFNNFISGLCIGIVLVFSFDALWWNYVGAPFYMGEEVKASVISFNEAADGLNAAMDRQRQSLGVEVIGAEDAIGDAYGPVEACWETNIEGPKVDVWDLPRPAVSSDGQGEMPRVK